MLIEFFCTNITGFDAAAGRNKTCGQRLVVSHDQIGQLISCKKCNQQVEVPFDVAKAKRSSDSASRKKKPAVAATKSAKTTHKKKTPAPSKKINELGLADPIDRVPTDVMTFEFEQDQVSALYDSVEKRCPKCGGLINENGKCSACRYVEPVYASSYLPLDQINMQTAGFQRWLCEIFNEGVSIQMIELGLHCMLGILAAIIVVASLLVGGFGGKLAIGLVIVCAFFYMGFIYKGHQLTKNPRAKLAWFQKPLWNLVLYAARSMKWSAYDSRYKGRVIVDKRNAPIVDEKVPYLEGLGKCQVLDLEGTLITDKGLRHLYGLSNLHCLVLRKTKVTHEGVLRLQQANPRLWIWY